MITDKYRKAIEQRKKTLINKWCRNSYIFVLEKEELKPLPPTTYKLKPKIKIQGYMSLITQ